MEREREGRGRGGREGERELGSLQYSLILCLLLQHQHSTNHYHTLTRPLPSSPAFSPASASTPKFLYGSSTPDCSLAAMLRQVGDK